MISSGTVQITLTFDSKADLDITQVQVQKKLQLAMPLLPQEVQQQGGKRIEIDQQFPGWEGSWLYL
ncbi:MAG: efflux RND transporter permease subunit [Symbiopectobacterium sp.]